MRLWLFIGLLLGTRKAFAFFHAVFFTIFLAHFLTPNRVNIPISVLHTYTHKPNARLHNMDGG